MGLNEAPFKAALLSVFNQMHSSDETKDDDWLAGQLAKVITDQIKTAAVPQSSVVVGVSGQATGTMNPAPINVI